MGKTIFNKNQLIKFILILFFLCKAAMVPAYAVLPNNKVQNHLTSSVVNIQGTHHQEIIVLIHGLMRTYMSMRPLKSYLESQGYQVYYYSYPSAKYTIQQHAVYLNQFVAKLLEENSGVKIHFITHSLGGIIIREALFKLSHTQLKNIGSLIMLAPPNQGSVLAKISIKIFPIITFFIRPLAELSSDEASYVHHVPVPDIKIGIIAGRFDAKVPPSAAYLEGQTAPVVINSTHTFIMNHAKTKQLIMSFLKTGTFDME